MKIEQVYNYVNDAQKEVLGEKAITLTNDLFNITDVGSALEDAMGVDAFYGKIANRIAKMLFTDRVYRGRLPKILKDSFEFGSIVGKLQAELIDAQQDESWAIINGASYDPFVVNLPVISSKFWNKLDAFEIDVTYPDNQIKTSFTSGNEMMRFLSMIETQVNNSMEVKIDALVSACLANFIGGILLDEVKRGTPTPRVVHLLTEYNTTAGTSHTAASALIDAGFLRYAVARLLEYKGFVANYSKLFNVGEKARHTPADLLHVVVNEVFASRCKTHLASQTYHEEFVKLPLYEEVSYWLGTGTSMALADCTKVAGVVEYNTQVGNVITTTKDDIDQDYVIAVMFDNEALGMLQPARRVRSQRNEKAEYTNYFNKWQSRYFNDFNEVGVVFCLD